MLGSVRRKSGSWLKSLFSKTDRKRRASRNGLNRRYGTETLELKTLLAADLTLLSDIAPAPASSNATEFIEVQGNAFFTATTAETGTELWITDGTSDETRIVRNLNGSISANPRELTGVGEVLYFIANDPNGAGELWKTDGSEVGTERVISTRTSTLSSIDNLIAFDDRLFFMGKDSASGTELWTSDGTEAGTVRFADINAGTGSSFPSRFVVVGSTLYFNANDGIAGLELWKTNGTPAGTTRVSDISPGTAGSNPNSLTRFGGEIYFTASVSGIGSELWRSDGTGSGTVLVRDIASGAGSSSPLELTAVGSHLYFTAIASGTGRELWRTDGTFSGTELVSDIFAGAGSSGIASLTSFQNSLYFTATDGIEGQELWRFDGTETEQVADILSGAASSFPMHLVASGNRLFFSAETPNFGRELWSTRGSAETTVQLKDIRAGSAGSTPEELFSFGSTILFVADDGVEGQELWRSDGSASGTTLLKNVATGGDDSLPSNFARVGSTVYFRANDQIHGTELWKTDGTIAGTSLVKDIAPGSNSGGGTSLITSQQSMIAFEDHLIFAATNGDSFGGPGNTGVELWTSDGTEAGTVLIKDINPGPSPSRPLNLVEFDDSIFFTAVAPGIGRELWRTDGTEAGTSLVAEIFAGSGSSNPELLTAVGESLYFVASDGSNTNTLWTTRGAQGTTAPVVDSEGNQISGIVTTGSRMVTNGSAVFFVRNDGIHGRELWTSDGTAAGTRLLRDIRQGSSGSGPKSLTAANGHVFFSTFDGGATGEELWMSDGTEAGTVIVKDIAPGRNSNPSSLTRIGNNVYFSAITADAGAELWVSDGSSEGTRLVADVHPGPGASNPEELTAGLRNLHFSAVNAAGQRLLWRFDTVTEQLTQVSSFEFERHNSGIPRIAALNDTVVMRAESEGTGEELFIVNAPPVITSQNVFVISGASVEIPTLVEDPDSGVLEFVITSDPEHGSISGVAPDLVYSPDPGFVGVDEFYIAVSDGIEQSTEGHISVTVVDEIPTITFAASSSSFFEGDGSIEVSLLLDRPAVGNLRIPLSISGSASPGEDYVLREDVFIAAGETTADIVIDVIDDATFEPGAAETVAISLGIVGYLDFGGISTHTVNLADNDSQPFATVFSYRSPYPVGSTHPENTPPETFGVYLSAPSTQTVSVPVTVSGTAVRGVDFTVPGLQPSVVFAPGQTVANFPIFVVDDNEAELAESMVFTLLEPSGATLATTGQGNISKSFVIHQNDAPAVQFGATTIQAGEESGLVTLNAMLSEPALQQIVVPLALAGDLQDGVDFTIPSRELVFEVGATHASLLVTLLNDETIEPTESGVFRILPNTNGEYEVGAQSLSELQVIDDDGREVSLSVSQNSVWENVGTVTLTATIPYAAADVVSVPLIASSSGQTGYATRSAGADYDLDLSPLVFQPGETTVTRSISIFNDGQNEVTERATISLGSPSANANLSEHSTVTVSILDDEPLISVVELQNWTNEVRTDIQFRIELSAATHTAVTVPFTLSGTASEGVGRDYILRSPNAIRQVVIPAGSTSVLVTVGILEDSVDEINETVTLTIRNPSSGILRDRSASTRIQDNDSAPVVTFLSPSATSSPSVQVREGNSVSVKVYSNVVSERDITVQVSFAVPHLDRRSARIDGLSNGRIVILAGRTEATFSFYAIDDSVAEWHDDVLVELGNVTNASRDQSLAGRRKWFSIPANDGYKTTTCKRGRFGSRYGCTTTTYNGRIIGGEVFVDANANRLRDFVDVNGDGLQNSDEPGEAFAITDADGAYSEFDFDQLDTNLDGTLDYRDGSLISTGGVDQSLNVPRVVLSSTPIGVSTITPLTTLADSLIRENGFSTESAMLRVAEAFGLSGVDIAEDDFIVGTTTSDATAAKAYATLSSLQSTVVELSAFLSALSGEIVSEQRLGIAIFDELAARIAADSSILNLTSSAVIASVLQGTANGLAIPGAEVFSGNAVVDTAVMVIAGLSDKALGLQLSDFETPDEFLDAVVKHKIVGQVQAGSRLRELASGSANPGDVIGEFTGSALNQRLLAAEPHVILPPLISVSDTAVLEGTDGITFAEFVVSLSREHDSDVTVSYLTQDQSARAVNGDYDVVSGTLTWVAGDNSDRIVQIPIYGDAELDPDKDFQLVLSDPINAAFETQGATARILSDEPINFDASILPGSETIHHLILVDSTTLVVGADEHTVFVGEHASDAVVSITGTPNRGDELTIDFSENSFRSDSFHLNGHSSDNDSVEVVAGTFSAIDIALGESGTGQSQFHPHDGESSPGVSWENVERQELRVSDVDVVTISLGGTITGEMILEDADLLEFGHVRLRSPTHQFEPLVFTNPNVQLNIVGRSDSANLTIGTLDERFLAIVVFSIEVGGQSPTDLNVSASSVNENLPSGTTVGTFSTADPDTGDSFSYALVAGSGDSDNSLFTIVGNELRTAASFDFETKASYSIRVQTTDSGGLMFEKAFTITVSDVNENPTALALDAASVSENRTSGTLVGSFSTTDVDAGESFSYSLIAGAGDTDNNSFSIVGDELQTAESLDFESQSSYSIRVQTMDSGGLTLEKSFAITVTDLDETVPTATISPLPLTWLSDSITLDVNLTDPNGPVGEPVSGVATYDVYVAIDSGSWALFADDVPATQTQVTYTPQSDHRYWFRATATDAAGNVELDSGTAETNTHTLDLDAPATEVQTATPEQATGIIRLDFSGTDTGGSGLRYFEAYVSLDDGAPEQIVGSPVNAGAASNGQYSGTLSYQGLRDGAEHTYRFYTRGVDGRGNQEAAPDSPNDVALTATFADQPNTEATGIDVQLGQTQRSYVRYVDVLFSNTSGLLDLFNNGRVELERFGINTSNPTAGTGSAVTGFSASSLGNALRLDFGQNGIGGRGAAGDGFYRISLDLDGDGQADDAHYEFFRLWGDATGDGSVTRNEHRRLFEDLNGDGRIDSRDRRDVRRQIGQSLNSLLLQFVDD